MVAIRRLPVLRIVHVRVDKDREQVIAVGNGRVIEAKDSKSAQRAYRTKYGPVREVIEDPKPKPLARVLERLMADQRN